jgi:hypothetical protein
MRARPVGHAVLMSIHKSGTNLVGRLAESLGYQLIGPGAGNSYANLEERWTSRGKSSLRWATSPDGLATFILSEYPTGTCACVHRLSASSSRTASIVKKRIPIVFNYRDPRDVLISEIYYTMNTPPPFPSRERESRLLNSMSSMEERLEHVMEAAHDYFDVTFRAHTWLLKEPSVQTVSYEELVGPRGGGTAAVQLGATGRVMRHLSGSAKGASDIAGTLYNTKVRTFRQGRIGSWRDEFTPALKRKFNSLHRDILEAYGYPER